MVEDFKHHLAGTPLPIDYYAIVEEIFDDKNYWINKTTSRTKPLNEALDILGQKGLTPEQIETIKELITVAVDKTVIDFQKKLMAFKTRNSETEYLGILLNDQRPPDSFIDRAKNNFCDSLAAAMGWKHTNFEKLTSLGMETDWPPLEPAQN